VCAERFFEYRALLNRKSTQSSIKTYVLIQGLCSVQTWGFSRVCRRGGGLGSRPKKMYGERLRDGVEYHLMSPTPRR